MSAADWITSGIIAFFLLMTFGGLLVHRIRNGKVPARKPRGSYSGEARR